MTLQLRMENLRHEYRTPAGDSHLVLDVGDWAITPGMQLLLRGVSGSGKTTLFNILSGLLTPSSGAVYYDAVAIYELSESERDRLRAATIGYIFQSHLLLNTLSALENVMTPMIFVQRGTHVTRRQRAMHLLEQLGIAAFAHYSPMRLSTGQRMRVMVARSLANEPRVIFADEPTASLDAEAAARVMDEVQQYCRASAATLITASHDPALASRFAVHVDLTEGQLMTTKAPVTHV